jgi:hypothetical protein
MTRKKHSKPSIEGLQVVCADLQRKFPEKYSGASAKIAYGSKSEAKAGAKRFDASQRQKPYLCRWCCYWHVGKNTNIGINEYQFVVPVKESLLLAESIVPDSPLAHEAWKLDFEDFFPENRAQYKSLMGYTRNYKNLYSMEDMKIFTVQSYARAVAWAIHVVPYQPVFLKDGDYFAFHKNAGNYWIQRPKLFSDG